MNDQLKKKLVVGGVGAAALAAAYFLGGNMDWGNAVQVLFTGDISTLCDQVEAL